jgi:hypothetical protein
VSYFCRCDYLGKEEKGEVDQEGEIHINRLSWASCDRVQKQTLLREI